MNIIDKDLNMLVVFKVVLEELSASRAAKRLNMSQPSLSHALKNCVGTLTTLYLRVNPEAWHPRR
ncbi:MAG: helix-turn-helix domain-containing protein [Pontibacterium sp.]